MKVKISEILSYLNEIGIEYKFCGDEKIVVEGYSSLANYKPNSFTWVKNKENISAVFDTARILLAFISPGANNAKVDFYNVIETVESKRAFFATIEHFYNEEGNEKRPPIGEFTYISPKVKLGKNVRVGHNCTLDGEIYIGDNTVIWNNVTIINRVKIGCNCVIQSGTVIGHDGFGYAESQGCEKHMIKHFGGVVIGDDVLLGSSVCVCRGTIDDTVIGKGTKIDNMSHIAHNCIIGSNVGMAYPCRLGGSSHIGNNAYLSSCVVRNQCNVGEGAFVGMGAVVVKDVAAGQIVVGNPAQEFKK